MLWSFWKFWYIHHNTDCKTKDNMYTKIILLNYIDDSTETKTKL